MGDLIQRLPTDDIRLPSEEKANFELLFGDTSSDNNVQIDIGPPEPMKKNVRFHEVQPDSVAAQRKEVISVVAFFVVFFVINLPWVVEAIHSYIPLCAKSWVATNGVQSLVAACILYFILNFNYSRK